MGPPMAADLGELNFRQGFSQSLNGCLDLQALGHSQMTVIWLEFSSLAQRISTTERATLEVGTLQLTRVHTQAMASVMRGHSGALLAPILAIAQDRTARNPAAWTLRAALV
jgi:hypothetical protein